MPKSPNVLFKDFLESFNGKGYGNHMFYDTVKEISRKKSGQREPLIDNDYCKMYSLDDMKDGCILLNENPPKSTDALCYKLEDGKLSLYLIEFKFHNLDEPDAKEQLNAFVDMIHTERKKYKCISDDERYGLYKIKKYYGDDVNHSLILKPIESLKVVIPMLYLEYCQKNPNIKKLDIERYLESIEKKYFVFVSSYSVDGKFNSENEILESQGTKLEQHFDRLVSGKIIDYYEILPRCHFDDFLEIEQLIE